MNALFADTSFFVAYLNPKSEENEVAHRYMTEETDLILTTEWVLAELANFLAQKGNRRLYMPLIKAILGEKRFAVVPASSSMFDRGIQLYARRPDKEWSFTDCTSFIVMEDEGLTTALTTDHHFEQAGFTALLR